MTSVVDTTSLNKPTDRPIKQKIIFYSRHTLHSDLTSRDTIRHEGQLSSS